MINFNKSAKLKLDLLLKGIRIDKNAYGGLGDIYKEYQYGYNDSNWISRTCRPTIPSELMLPGEVVVAPHLRPSSPYLIKKMDDGLWVLDEVSGQLLSPISYLPRPEIWELPLSDGSKLKRYLNIYGLNCLNLFVVANCDFWTQGQPCAFCSLQPTQSLHKEVVTYKPLEIIEEAVSMAFTHDPSLEWMIITGGSLMDRKAEVERYINVLDLVKKHIPKGWQGRIKGNVALLPTNDTKDLERLYLTGIEHPSFNMEVWDEGLFGKYCPGKNRFASFHTLMETYKKAVDIWGYGEVWCNFVGGISPLEKIKEGFKYMADLGVVPGANIFHVDPKAPATRLGLTEPSEEYVYGMYEALVEIYKAYDFKPFFNHSVLRNSLSNEMYNGWL